MTKIKSIDISDFRIYQGNHEFSFESTQGLSNLMVIYAPNGFGKTSFFDAIEWCYSNKIRRFENEYIHEEIERKEYSDGHKILLTNRKSYKAGKKGMVTIYTANQKTVKRVAKVRKITNSEFKHDYRPGSDLTSDIDESVLAKLIKTNILTQDQIDSFLRYTRPEEKFTALQEFWPEGESATEILKKLDSYKVMTDLEVASLNNRIVDCQDGIAALLNSSGNVEVVNTSVEAVTKISLSGFKVEPLSGVIDDELYNAVQDVAQGSIKRNFTLREKSRNDLSRLKILASGFNAYQQAAKASSNLQAELNQINELDKLYVDSQTFSKTIVTAEQQISERQGLMQLYARLLEILQQYRTLVQTIQDQQKIINDIYQDNEQLLNQIEVFGESLQNLQLKETEIKKQVEDLKESLSNWDDNFNSHQYWTKELQKQKDELARLASEIKVFSEKIIFQTTRKRYLATIAENLNFSDLQDVDRATLTEQLSEYSLIVSQLKETNEKIETQNSEFARAASLDESLDRLLSWGEDIVRTTDAIHCPLCATKFEDAEALLILIENQKQIRNVNDLLKDNLRLLMDKSADSIKRRDNITSQIKQYLTTEIAICDQLITEAQTQRDSLANLEKDAQNAKEHAEVSVDRFFELLLPNKNLLSEPIDLGLLKFDLSESLVKLETKLQKQSALISKKQEAIGKKRYDHNLNQVKVNSAENSVALSQSEQIYMEGNRLINELKIHQTALTAQYLQQNIGRYQMEIDDLQQQVNNAQSQLNLTQQKLNTFVNPLTQTELPGSKIAKQSERSQHDQVIANFLRDYNIDFPEIQPDLKTIESEVQAKEELLKKLEEESELLNELTIKLALIEENVNKNRLEKELEELNIKLPPLQSAAEQLELAKERAKNYIDQEISNYFNQDVINQIYSRIEPHPDLNMIDFDPQVTDKGPILNVQAVSKDDKLNPVLYLSAGQLNVLSLSIFLAKAFEVGNEAISTVFMDDPIQNLSDINVLSFIDLIRAMITNYDRQIVISTHDENFYKLIKNKMPTEDFNTVYYEMANFGQANRVM